MTLLINNLPLTASQMTSIRSDLGFGNDLPGAAVIGPYATTTLLEAAYPAAANVGKTAYVGAAAPYTEYISNGSVAGWKAVTTYVMDANNNVSSIILPSGVAVSIPAMTFHGVGTIAAPLSSVTMNATQGRVGPPANILIPANTLKVGSKVTGRVKYKKTGGAVTGGCYLYALLGTGNGTSDAAALNCGIGVGFDTIGWMSFDFDITGSGTVLGSNYFYIANIGAGGDTVETISATINIAQPMYISFSFTAGGIGAGTDVVKLLEYDVQVYA